MKTLLLLCLAIASFSLDAAAQELTRWRVSKPDGSKEIVELPADHSYPTPEGTTMETNFYESEPKEETSDVTITLKLDSKTEITPELLETLKESIRRNLNTEVFKGAETIGEVTAKDSKDVKAEAAVEATK